MGRTKELLDNEFYVETAEDRLKAFAEDGRAQARELARERGWARSHPAEWAAWLELQPLWMPVIDFGAVGGAGYGFEEFLREVGAPAPEGGRVERKDTRLPFRPGNLKWVRPESRDEDSPYYDYEAAALYCNCSVKTLQNAKCRGELSPVAGGSGVNFERRELDRFMKTPARRRAGPR